MYIRLNNHPSTSIGKYYFRITICDSTISLTNNVIPYYIYVLNSHAGEKHEVDCLTYFNIAGLGNNCPLASPACHVTNDDGSAYNDGVISVDSTTNFVKIKTNAAYSTKTVRIHVTTGLGVTMFK
jgi:hypothetical protein